MNEIWKDIPNYEGEYQASNMGRIRSLDRYVRGINHYSGREFRRRISGKILKPARFCKSGHVSVVLDHGNSGIPVHQLVMRAFVGEPPAGMEVLHINGNPKDNRLENLRYGTRTENILDVYYQGGSGENYRLRMFIKYVSDYVQGLRVLSYQKCMVYHVLL